MQSRTWHWSIGLLAALTVGGCAVAERPAADAARSYSGWYMEHAGQGSFQACGESQAWRVSAAADLPARAKVFGLQENMPTYVRVLGVVHGDELAVARVEQFGSPIPVRNCAMTGVVIPAPSPVKD